MNCLTCLAAVSVGMELFHTSRTRNNHPALAVIVCGTACIRKTIGRHRSAWFLPLRIRTAGMK